MNHRTLGITLALALVMGCSDAPVDARTQAIESTKAAINADLAELTSAVRDLRAAAPAPDADGWNAAADAASVARMRAAWKRARRAYEHVEGAVALLFRDLDVSMDERYDGFVVELPGRRDADLFDGEGVTGMHAVERILWSNETPSYVVTFERGVAGEGYTPAAFPSNAAEATAFRDGLTARLVRDAEQLQREFAPLALDTAAAYRGVIGSIAEQVEKLSKAATAEEESRYSNTTLYDMRANLEGARRTFAAFRPWLVERGRQALITSIDARFDAIDRAYTSIGTDALPRVPDGWNPDAPTAAQLATPYGQLHALLTRESDEATQGSLVALMNAAADVMGIARLAR